MSGVSEENSRSIWVDRPGFERHGNPAYLAQWGDAKRRPIV
jgi:hypothetical protein